MFFTESELKILLWCVFETTLLVVVLIGSFDGMKRDWNEIKRLRADKESLAEILLAFLKGQIETQTSKTNKDEEVKHE